LTATRARRRAGTDQPGQDALEQEGQLDVEVAGPDQAHDAGLPAPAVRGDADGVADQQHRRDHLHPGDDQRDELQLVQDVEEALEQLLLVLHLLDAGTGREGVRHDGELRRVLELDAERLRQRVGGDVLDQVGRVLELLAELLVRLLLRLVVDGLHLGHRLEVGLELLPLLVGDRRPPQVRAWLASPQR
jgi:hypothetical protein